MRRIKSLVPAVFLVLGIALMLGALLWDSASIGAALNDGNPISQRFEASLTALRAMMLAGALACFGIAALLHYRALEAARLLRRRRMLLLGILTLLITVFVMLVIGEIAVRLFAAGTYDAGGAEYQKLMSQIPLNSHGMRDREYSLEKPQGTYRILVIGDSFTFGHGIVDTSQIWPELLEQSLNEQSAVEVINTGRNGLQTSHEIAILNETLAFEPDMVMLGYFFNDAMTDEMLTSQENIRYGPVSGLLRGADAVLFTHSYLYSFLKTRGTAVAIRFGMEKSYPQEMNDVYKQPLNVHKQQLLAMRDMATAANASFIIVLIPGNYDFENYPLADGHEFMNRFCTEEGISCIDLLPVFQQEDYRITRLNPYDAHPSIYGHELIAHELAQAQELNRALEEHNTDG